MAREIAPGRSFKAENRAFEHWLERHCAVVKNDLEKKHEKMRKDAFTFLRATYFRWARRVEAVCPDLAMAPVVLSVGDVHLENFGTWRDAEGRLVWGINDFDEAAVMPYAFDLVRLVASAHLAPAVAMEIGAIAAAVRKGYRRALEQPRPILLDENETWMRPYAACSDAEREDFWREVDGLPTALPPRAVRRDLQRSLPGSARIVRFATRVKGSGGLGRPRFIADAVWCGGRVVREAKALVPSAWTWAHQDSRKRESETKPRFEELSSGPYRAPDPWLAQRHGYIFRRIAADSRKVDLSPGDQAKLNRLLLEAMGFDLGAIHAATKKSRLRAIVADLDHRPQQWLRSAALNMAADVTRDFEEWTA